MDWIKLDYKTEVRVSDDKVELRFLDGDALYGGSWWVYEVVGLDAAKRLVEVLKEKLCTT